MTIKDFCGRLYRIYQLLKISINNRINERKNKIEGEKLVMLAPKKIEQLLIKNSENIEKENLNLKKIIKENYDGVRKIGESPVYLWDCLSNSKKYVGTWNDVENLNKKTENINSFELDVREINWVTACKEYQDGTGKHSLDDYIENNNTLLFFLRKDKKNFSENIRNKIDTFSDNENGKEILSTFNSSEIDEIIKGFREYGIVSKSFSENSENIPIELVSYNGNVEWINTQSVHTHHFLILRYILKTLNKSEILKDSKRFQLTYLKNIFINEFFDSSEIFIIPYIPYNEREKLSMIHKEELVYNLQKISNIKIREYDKLIDFYKKIRHSFLFVCLEKKEKSHSELINIFKENNFFNLKDYYDKYLKEQNKNLKKYIEKKWITKEKIEGLEGLELF